jgi:hypothetical protein
MAIISSSMAYKADISVTDIGENSRVVSFEGKVLNIYGIFNFVHSENSKKTS